MEVEDITADETDVLRRWSGSAVVATGKTTSMNLHHFFRFREGKIAYWRGTEDTAQTVAALQPWPLPARPVAAAGVATATPAVALRSCRSRRRS